GSIETIHGNLIASGKISGNALIKTGLGTLTPTNTDNNYTGETEIKEGKLSIESPEVLGNPNGKIILQTGDLQTTKDLTLENPVIANGGALDTTGILTISGQITGKGPLKKMGTGTLKLCNLTNNYYEGTHIEEGNIYITDPQSLGEAKGNIVLVKGNLQTQGDMKLEHPINIGKGAIETVSGVLTANGLITGKGSLKKTGKGTFYPTNTNNNYIGTTEIVEGTLIISDLKALGNPSNKLIIKGIFKIIPNVSSPNYSYHMAQNAPLIITGPFIVEGAELHTEMDMQLDGPIQGPGPFIKKGKATLTLTNSNTSYAGDTKIQEGTVILDKENVLGNQGKIILQGGDLEINNSLTLYNTLLVEKKAKLQVPSESTLVMNNLQGTATLNKEGMGKWMCTQQSNYKGNINVNDGVFQIDGIFAASNVTVAKASTLQGSGTINSNITNNGIVQYSEDSDQMLTIGGDYNQTPEGTLKLKIHSGNKKDRLTIKGRGELKGTLKAGLAPGIYRQKKRYNLIHAEKGMDIQFSQVAFDFNDVPKVEITTNDFDIFFVEKPVLILPVSLNKLSKKQKNIGKYLFCENFPIEDEKYIDLFENMLSLPPNAFVKALSTLTPEHYGALPIGESKIIQYLLTRNLPTCQLICPCSRNITILPIYLRNETHKRCSSLPNYIQNSAGLRIQSSFLYTTDFITKVSASYLSTKTCWSQHRGKACGDGIYFDAALCCNKDNFYFSLGLLLGYSRIKANHYVFLGYPIKARAKPSQRDIAESLTLKYNYTYNVISFLPHITLVQSNILLNKLCENKPKGLNLQTESKRFSFLDTLISLKIQGQKNYCCACIKPYLDLGWHNMVQLTCSTFHSRLDNYRFCSPGFTTETYRGNYNTLFMELGITFSYIDNVDIMLNSRTEIGRRDFVQAVNLGIHWSF
ncbi:MAG: autotransporter-associated beta strand repeat-containing protein, partial [Chlamydiales bacterium]